MTVNVAHTYTPSDENIALLSGKLLAGELVAVPTETVYGLAANVFDETACTEIFRAKGRPAFDPLIVHLPAGYDLGSIAEVNSAVGPLASAFWPGPLTLVLHKKAVVPDIVTSGMESVAVRISRHPVFQKLLQACNIPLAAPSANPFGYVSPTSAEHVQNGLGTRIRHILDGGPCEVGVESTILDIRNPGKPLVLRPGGVPRSEITRVLGEWVSTAAGATGEVMPGQLMKHYSPRAAFDLRDRLNPDEVMKNPDRAFLFYRRPGRGVANEPNVFWLSEKGDDAEAARSLFHLLREIDSGGFVSASAERAPPSDLAEAINDRLSRAAASTNEA